MRHREWKALVASVLLVSCNAVPQATPIAHLERALSASDEVRFYFLSFSDEPSFSAAEMPSQASVSIVRKCGANCRQYMAEVLNHLKASKPIDCIDRDQSVLIIVKEAPPIVYSHGGHRIKLSGKCYFNQQSVNDIIEQRSFIF